jgi:hypothetical protein
MGLSRSTFYDAPAVHLDDAEIVARMQTIVSGVQTSPSTDLR